METTGFNASECCSRKNWQIVNRQQDKQISDRELAEAISELATRRHYLAELREIGKLEERSTGA